MIKVLTIVSFIGAAAVVLLTALHLIAYAVMCGVGLGAVYFLVGVGQGGRIGNAQGIGKKPQDSVTRIGICHAATGVAAASIGHQPPFPVSFIVLYWVFLVAGAAGACFLGWKQLMAIKQSEPKSILSSKDS